MIWFSNCVTNGNYCSELQENLETNNYVISV